MAGRMTEARRKHLSDLALARIAALPRNESCRKCGTPITSKFIFCRDCWFGLSDDHRAALHAAFVPGTDLRQQPDPAYWAAVEEACR